MDSHGTESTQAWGDACHTGAHPQADFSLAGHKGPEVWNWLAIDARPVPGCPVRNIDDVDPDRPLRAVIRALRPDGLFARPYAFRSAPAALPDDDAPWNCKEGGVCRMPETMAARMAQAGGRVVRDWGLGEFSDCGSGWRALHIVRDGGPR